MLQDTKGHYTDCIDQNSKSMYVKNTCYLMYRQLNNKRDRLMFHCLMNMSSMAKQFLAMDTEVLCTGHRPVRLLSAFPTGDSLFIVQFISPVLLFVLLQNGSLMILSHSSQLLFRSSGNELVPLIQSCVKCVSCYDNKVVLLTKDQLTSVSAGKTDVVKQGGMASSDSLIVHVLGNGGLYSRPSTGQMFCNNTLRPCAVDDTLYMICVNCERQVCLLLRPCTAGLARCIQGPHRYEIFYVQGSETVERGVNCKQIRCEKAGNYQTHCFDNNSVFLHFLHRSLARSSFTAASPSHSLPSPQTRSLTRSLQGPPGTSYFRTIQFSRISNWILFRS